MWRLNVDMFLLSWQNIGLKTRLKTKLKIGVVLENDKFRAIKSKGNILLQSALSFTVVEE